VNQHELLTKLDGWRNYRCDDYTLELVKAAAEEIRRLQTHQRDLAATLDELTGTISNPAPYTSELSEAGL